MKVTKKYGSLSHVVIGTDIFVVLAKPEDYKVNFSNILKLL